jgi:hypothetical protein
MAIMIIITITPAPMVLPQHILYLMQPNAPTLLILILPRKLPFVLTARKLLLHCPMAKIWVLNLVLRIFCLHRQLKIKYIIFLDINCEQR